MYGLSKLHKDPIVGIDSITEGISRIADYYMEKIIPHAPSDLRDSHTLIKKIKKIGPLPSNVKLFTADATAMYTTISNVHQHTT
jgi:hypothetical protein